MNKVLPVIEEHVFRDCDFVGGNPVLDFVNTVTGRNGRPRDWLSSPAALIAWALRANVVTADEAEVLACSVREPTKDPAESLERAKRVRETLYGVLDSIVSGRSPDEKLGAIERDWRTAMSRAHLGWSKDHGVEAHIAATDIDAIVDRVLAEWIALGPELASQRLRRCAGENCAWFFLDSSKAGRRRWCDMATCGNASKYSQWRARKDSNLRPPDS